MTPIYKINQLRQLINEKLFPLIKGDHVYLELPYYPNIGDNLIWEGTKNFLSQIEGKCLYSAGIETFYEHSLSKDTTILLQGGGNFGDLWARHHLFRKKIIELYPQNPVIVLPQSVCYENVQNITEDEHFFAKHSNVCLCARDQVSYNFMKQHFPQNNVFLVPDMAFFADLEKFKIQQKKTGRILFAKRLDKEFADNYRLAEIPQMADIHDWPTFEFTAKKYRCLDYIDGWLNFFANIKGIKSINNLRDIIRDRFYRYQYIKDGISFLSQYDTVYATRLHIAIMAAMLGKQVYIIDNSYGKNVNLYNTWLKDLDNVHIF